jgi:hypothetical protein
MSAAAVYALVNESHAPELTPTSLSVIVCDAQDAYDGPFASSWGVLPVTVILGGLLVAAARVCHLVDTIPEAPNALAYHTVDAQGRPVLRLGVETIRSALSAGQNLLDEISKAFTHELFETAVDPFVSLYCQVNGKTAMLSYETCDPVQGGSFKQGSSAISNFVLPAYFDASDTDGPWDYCKQLSASLTCASDGYQAWSDGTQTFGTAMSDVRKFQAMRFGRRTRGFEKR